MTALMTCIAACLLGQTAPPVSPTTDVKSIPQADPENFGFWDRIWLRTPTSMPQSHDTDAMFMWLWWFCTIWFVVLMFLMVYWVIRYRRRPGTIAERSPSHSTPLELTWTIVPSLFLVYIFFRGFEGFMAKVVPPGNAVQLNLTGYRWQWDLEYPNGVVINAGTPNHATVLSATSIPIFYVPAETPIRLRMNSTDVMHAFWVPDFRIKSDLIPNRYTVVWFEAVAPGADAQKHPMTQADVDPNGKGAAFIPELAGEPYTDHWVFCAEYCGTAHSEMWAIVRVVSDGAYQRWLKAMAVASMPSDPVALGKVVYKARCATCHSVDGSANTGPTWLNMYGNSFPHDGGQQHTLDDNFIVESIRNPGRHVREGFANNMTAFSEGLVNQRQVEGILAYMRTLSDKGGAPPAQPEALGEGNTPGSPPPAGSTSPPGSTSKPGETPVTPPSPAPH